MNFKETIRRFIPPFLLSWYHDGWSLVGAVVFGFPGKNKNITIIGITGTSGKSTTVDFVTRILEEAGHKVVSNSSIRFKVADKERENDKKMGMPGRFFMQKLLADGKKSGCDYAVLEVTSEGIKQHRHKFINFNTVVFTNLTPEHIESHGGFENYRNEKLKLFKATNNIHVINADDENAKYFLDTPYKEKVTFGIKKVKANVVASNISVGSGISFKVKNTDFYLKMSGAFNVYNALAAISVARSQNISLDICKKALEKAKGISGRMEIIQDKPFQVVVDYAHTPAQLEAVYNSFTGKNLVCVLGSCGGGRDKWKRPVLGEIASKYCKKVIITNEDPYDENPIEIMEQVASGVEKSKDTYDIVVDRKEAIKKALEVAKPDEVVIITGKGSEMWMCLENGKKIPWDDRKISKELLKIA